jgi:hypothetical protein
MGSLRRDCLLTQSHCAKGSDIEMDKSDAAAAYSKAVEHAIGSTSGCQNL